MTKYMSGALALVVGLGVATADAAPYTFFSGTVDVTANTAGFTGGINRPDAKRINATAGGAGYNNTFTGSNGGLLFGSKISAVGFIPITNVASGAALNQDLGTGSNNLVGVYALQGLINPNVADPRSIFDPGTTFPAAAGAPAGAAGGTLAFYDRSNIVGDPLANNPLTWIDGNSKLLATVSVFPRADGYEVGPPGPNVTVAPQFVGGGEPFVNSLAFQVGQPTTDFSGDFKFVFPGGDNPELGTLFADFDVSPDFDGDLIADLIGTFRQISFDLFTNVEQVAQQGETGMPDATDIANLNALFDRILDGVIDGDLFSDEAGLPGDNFDNVSNNNVIQVNNGDNFVLNNGGNSIPGGQFEPIVEPEPTTLLVWGVVGAIGYVTCRRRISTRPFA